MDNDYEIALEEAIQRIDDTNESDEEFGENMSVIQEEDNEEMPRAFHRQRVFPRPVTEPTIVSLKQVMDDGRSFTLFRRFLKDQCISRNLQFWLACEFYCSQPPSDKINMIEMAKAIYVKFLKSSAPLHVSIMDSTRRKIQFCMQHGSEPDCMLFKQAQEEVYQQMEANELRQFLCSDAFSDCSQFNGGEANNYLSEIGPIGFQPARYRGGSLHSSDDSTSITGYTSEDTAMCGTVLCMPRLSIPPHSPRNAHSDTEHSSRQRHMAGKMTYFSRSKILTQQEFYEILYDRLSAVEKDRANLKQRARNIAREAGKKYEDIMSLEWYDAPEAIKYIGFDEQGDSDLQTSGDVGRVSSVDQVGSPMQQDLSNQFGSSHIITIAAKEIQEAVKDLDITRQVRQKRSSSLISSSTSSYVSDSGVSESQLPSSESGPHRYNGGHRVQAYLQSQQRINSRLTDREAKAQIAATLLMNNSTHREDLNPLHRRNFHSSDDSSSCFTTTSHSSNSEFFIPRRSHNLYTDSDSSRHQQSRYPPGMRRLSHHRRSQPPTTMTPRNLTYQQQQTSTRVMSPAVHTPGSTPTSNTSDSLLVAYTMDGFNNTIGKRIVASQLTLGDFKERVFARRGNFRFFFKSFCEELDQTIMEEMSEDSQQLPLFEGKIIGHVEKVDPCD